MDEKETNPAKLLGSKGGKKTKEKHGEKHYSRIGKLGALARKRKRKLDKKRKP